MATERFISVILVAFDADFGVWTKTLAEEGMSCRMLGRKERVPYADKVQVSPIPLPAFTGFWRMLEITPLT